MSTACPFPEMWPTMVGIIMHARLHLLKPQPHVKVSATTFVKLVFALLVAWMFWGCRPSFAVCSQTLPLEQCSKIGKSVCVSTRHGRGTLTCLVVVEQSSGGMGRANANEMLQGMHVCIIAKVLKVER